MVEAGDRFELPAFTPSLWRIVRAAWAGAFAVWLLQTLIWSGLSIYLGVFVEEFTLAEMIRWHQMPLLIGFGGSAAWLVLAAIAVRLRAQHSDGADTT